MTGANADDALPSLFPPWLDRVQLKYMNPVMRRFSSYLPGASIIEHRGRTSGKPYETVVTTYCKDGLLAIALGHGKTDWVKNVLAAGEADVRPFRRHVHITNPRILPPGSRVDGLPRVVRVQGRRVGVFIADIV